MGSEFSGRWVLVNKNAIERAMGFQVSKPPKSTFDLPGSFNLILNNLKLSTIFAFFKTH
jgi:hypothetical protein